MKAGKDDKSKCTVQAKAGRNGKVVFATLSPLGLLFPMGTTQMCEIKTLDRTGYNRQWIRTNVTLSLLN